MRRISLFVHFLSKQKSWRGMLLLAVAIVGFSYLVSVISISTRGYKMRDLERRADELKLENKKLNLEIAQMQSPARIEEWVKTSGMVASSNVRYVSATTGVVATR
ncbi:MAG: hypothetical protein Q7S48_03815 [bacterium]|nr:hypothetical protein [bacterium]